MEVTIADIVITLLVTCVVKCRVHRGELVIHCFADSQ
jgi:hypothetical protein